MMKKENLEQLLATKIIDLIDFEKACAKTYLKLEKAALAPELAKALHPEQTGIQSHIQRLLLVKKMLSAKAIGKTPAVTINSIKLAKAKTDERDIAILAHALQLQSLKISGYETLLALVKKMLNAPAPDLIEQCIAENQDTVIWLKRTLHHYLLA